MLNHRRQRGMGLMGWMVAILVAISIGSVAMRVFPHYTDNQAILSSIKAMEGTGDLGKLSRREFFETIKRRMATNNIRNVDPMSIMKWERNADSIVVTVEYERREPLVWNMFLVVRFSDSVQASSRGG